MWSLFARIFSSPEAITKTVDTVAKGLDALVYTEEEKAQSAAADRTEARGKIVEWMNATSGQNLARRWLSMVITTVWLAQYILAQLFAMAAIWVPSPEKYLRSSELMSSYAESMNGAVMLILGFYFAAPHLGKVVDVAMTKFGRSARPGSTQ